MELSHSLHSPDVLSRATALREVCQQAAAFAQVPNVDSLLSNRSERLPKKLAELVDHVSYLSHMTTRFLKDLSFDGPIILLGRDATPVAIGVGWCSQALGLSIPLRSMDISNKFFKMGWDSTHTSEPKAGDPSFITRLINHQVSPEEARSSGLWKFFEQNDLNVKSKCLLIDNGVNGTLLSRLNAVLQICDPELEVHNALLYYSGAIELPRVHTIVEHQPKLTGVPTTSDLQAIGRFSQDSVKIEGWPHPYPSLSHIEMIEGRAIPRYAPSQDITSEGRIEAQVDWETHSVQHLRALQKLRATILG